MYVSVEVAIPVLASGGKAPLAFQIPLDTSLNGLKFYNQGVALTPPVVTNAGVGVIGLK